MENNRIKYIHMMSHPSMLYNKAIVHMINYDSDRFNSKEHLFIISNKKVYDDVAQFENVIYEKDINNDVKVIKKYANMCNYIFLHCNTLSTKTLVLLEKNILNKIIWSIWGDDLYSKREEAHTLYRKIRRTIGNLVRFIPEQIRKSRIKKFYAIGLSFQYDAIEIKRVYGKNMRIVTTPYGYRENNKAIIDNIIANTSDKKNNECCKIMVGHSAFKFLNHIELLEKLSKYKDENICISLILSYGEKEYAEIVKQKALKIFGEEKVEIIEEMMTNEEYIQYLNNIDICLFDFKHQAAMANVFLLLYMGKKLFLNKEGIIKLFTTIENIETCNVEDIEDMNFEEFSKKIKNPKYGKKFAEFHISEENNKELWYNTLKSLDKMIEKEL